MEEAIPLIINGIALAVKEAPQVVAIVKAGKDFITSLFTNNVISKETQDRVHAHLDALADSVDSGIVPPEFVVTQ